MKTYEEPVSRELWYTAQVAMKDTIKELSTDVKESREEIAVISEDIKKLLIQVTTANGRTRKLEDWSNDSKIILEATGKLASSTLTLLKVERTRIWTALLLAIFFGSTIIGLAIMAIDSKIKDGIAQALQANVSTITLEK